MSVVSSVLSRVSTPSTGWRINVRLSSLMDSIFAIGFGLGLRFVVDTVSNHDFKLTGTLVGLWEGVITLHFLKKMPKSSDPYIAFGVRLFIDFIYTESIARMVLVLIWTALGMVLADITPAIWEDVGLKRVWKSFRRDLYTITRMIPTVAFFPPTRTVRFSPSREPSVIVDEATEVLSPSVIAEQTPITNNDPFSSTAPRVVYKRRVPGYFPADYSDTETDSSLRAEGFAPQGRTSRRLSVYPQIPDYDDDTVSDLSGSQNDLDEANLSSDGTETGEPPSALPDASEIPEIEDEPLLVDVTAVPVKPEDGELTPTQQRQPYMPPTPSDSAARWGINRDIEEPLPVRPPSELLPQIPDFLEEPVSEDWEKIQHADYSEEKPPTPPAKDKPVGFKIPDVPSVPPPVPPVVQQPPQSTTPPDDDMNGWDTLESQFLTRDMNNSGNAPEDANANATNEDTKRQSLPPPYIDYESHDDIYDDPPRNPAIDLPTRNLIDDDIYDDPPRNPAIDLPTRNLIDDDTGVPPAEQDVFNDNKLSLLPPVPSVDPSLNPWGDATAQQPTHSGGDDFEEQLKRDQEAQQLKAKQEAEEADRKAAEDAQKRAKKEAEEERNRKKAQEKAEREKKEADDEIIRQKKREEEEAAEKARKAEEQKRLKEEAEKKKAEELAQKKKDAEEAQARREAAEAKKTEDKRLRKEAKEEEKRLKEEAKKAEEAKKEEERIEAERLKEEVKKAKEAKKEAERIEAERLKAEQAEAAKKEAERIETERLQAEEEAAKEAERVKEEQLQKELEDVAKLKEKLQAEADEQAKADALKLESNAQQKQEQEQTTDHAADVTTQEQETAPAPEETTEDVKTPVGLVRPLEGDPAEHPLSPAEPSHPAPSEIADTVSEASEAPSKAVDRVERMLSLRAQMVEMEANLENLKNNGSDPSSPEVKQVEKILRKMNRQAERRYAAGISCSYMLNDQKEPDSISLGTQNDIRTEAMIAEKIEALLTPASKSLYLVIFVGKKAVDQRRQKGVIVRLLDDYNLAEYSFDSGKKGRIIDVSEDQFADWLKGYRILSTQERNPTSIWD
ncbi:hypothetical protein CVT25_015861 [Psilocybe cyanescens]|uniref:Uncharacterized protein n=1 Tax=Psilocybe cyanescens TaxID=93625 RepID=A0A409XIG6_PSICY|nr:hypothetical protein CVT25_015861 [Psilocybe cyanescens]